MAERQIFRGSPLARDWRSSAVPALGLGTSAALALAYVLGAGEAFSVVGGLVALAAICSGAIAHQRARVARLAPTEILLTDAALVVGRQRVARADLKHGVVVPVEDGALVQLRSSRFRQPIVVHFEDEGEAHRLLDALGLGAQRMAARFVTLSPWLASRWFVGGLLAAFALVFALAVAVLPLGWPPHLAVMAIGLLLVPTMLTAVPGSFSVGLDGVRYGHLGRKRFLPWSEIERVAPYRAKSFLTDSGGIEIVVRGSAAPLRIPLGTDALVGDTPERLAARIEQARAAADQARAGLELHGPFRDRVRAAKAVLEGESRYRHAYVDPGVVSALLSDPTARAEDRVAAAVALAGSGSGGRERVRVAAETTVDATLRAALEAVASDEASAVVEATLARRAPLRR
jgi:hypothetical protein